MVVGAIAGAIQGPNVIRVLLTLPQLSVEQRVMEGKRPNQNSDTILICFRLSFIRHTTTPASVCSGRKIGWSRANSDDKYSMVSKNDCTSLMVTIMSSKKWPPNSSEGMNFCTPNNIRMEFTIGVFSPLVAIVLSSNLLAEPESK